MTSAPFPVEVLGSALELPVPCRVPASLQALIAPESGKSIEKHQCVVRLGDTAVSVPAAAVCLCLSRLATCQIASAATGSEHVKGGNIYAELVSSDFVPQALDSAEALMVREEYGPNPAWYLGRVFTSAQNSYLFEPVPAKDAPPRAVPVSLSALRRPRDLPSLVDWLRNESVRTEELVIPAEAEDFFHSEAGLAFIYDTLWERSGILLAIPDFSTTPHKLTLLGSLPSVEIASAQVGLQVKNVCDAGSFQERRTRRLKLLEERRNGVENTERMEFFVHESLVGSVIGKQGENLSRVARLHKVEVRVFPDENGVRRIRVYGADSAKLKRARAELDYQYYEISLPPEAERFVEWMLDEANGVKDLASRQNLHSLWYDPERGSILVCGLARIIDDFLRALHMAYRDSTPQKPITTASASPPTTAVQSRSSSRSATPLLSSPLPGNFGSGPRPPVIEALPTYSRAPEKPFRPASPPLWQPPTLEYIRQRPPQYYYDYANAFDVDTQYMPLAYDSSSWWTLH